jgi:hypothetical protein
VSQAKLPNRELKGLRAKKLKRQKGVCPLCKTEILEGEDTLDHCHDSGNIRAVLHRSCNAAEGQVKRWSGQRSRGDDPAEWLRNLLRYWSKDYSKNAIHPTHGRKRKRRKRRAKK